jgi:2'-5' RNA ligase
MAQKPNTQFPFGTIQAEIPESSPAVVALRSVREDIAEEDLAGRGRDIGPPHITLRYGIQGDSTFAIKALLEAHKPIATTLGATSSFSPSASRDVAVIIANISSPELYALNQRLGEIADFAEQTHEYEPHVTVAYVRPEVAKKYVGNQVTAGHTFLISEVVIRTQSKDEMIVTLNG